VLILKSILIWILMIPFAILNGGLRIYITEPLLGENIALPLSGIILSIVIVLLAYFLLPKLGKGKSIEYIFIGLLWFTLTNLFDLIIFFIEGVPIIEFFKAFDVTTGNLWLLVVIVCLISPIIVAKSRKLIID